MPPSGQPERSAEQRWFATTHWSMVLNAADAVSPHSEKALENLCRSYWPPLYTYLRRRGHDAESAKDLTQEFFSQLLAKQLLHGLDPAKGRFRSWLLGVMKHFLAHEWTRAHAQKRGGGAQFLSLDVIEVENRCLTERNSNENPEKAFDRRWAFTVLNRAAAELRAEYEAAGKGSLYQALKEFVSTEGTGGGYEDAARGLGMSTSAVKSAIYRLRQRYQQLIREQIGQTVATVAEIDEEIRYLLSIITENGETPSRILGI